MQNSVFHNYQVLASKAALRSVHARHQDTKRRFRPGTLQRDVRYCPRILLWRLGRNVSRTQYSVFRSYAHNWSFLPSSFRSFDHAVVRHTLWVCAADTFMSQSDAIHIEAVLGIDPEFPLLPVVFDSVRCMSPWVQALVLPNNLIFVHLLILAESVFDSFIAVALPYYPTGYHIVPLPVILNHIAGVEWFCGCIWAMENELRRMHTWLSLWSTVFQLLPPTLLHRMLQGMCCLAFNSFESHFFSLCIPNR